MKLNGYKIVIIINLGVINNFIFLIIIRVTDLLTREEKQ